MNALHEELLLPEQDGTLAVVGLGHIGSHFLDAIARQSRLKRLILVDRDSYEAANVGNQRVDAKEALRGRPKVETQADHARRIRPDLEVIAHFQDVADLPLGNLRATLVVSGLDSLEARLQLNTAVFRLGVPWLDAGVQPSTGLVRVTGYRPGKGAACFACGLEDEDYEQRLSSVHPCAQEGGRGHTGGTPGFGALAGAMLAATAEGILNGTDGIDVIFGRESLWNCHHFVHLLSSFRQNPACRFDHRTWAIRPMPTLGNGARLQDLFEALHRAGGSAKDTTFDLGGRRLAARAQCPRCGHVREGWHLTGRLPMAGRACPACGRGRLAVAGFDALPLCPNALPKEVLEQPLVSLGIGNGDVLEASHDRTVAHWEVRLPATIPSQYPAPRTSLDGLKGALEANQAPGRDEVRMEIPNPNQP